MALLVDADRLEPLVQLIGAAALPEHERLVLGSARVLREGVFAQSATSSADAYCSAARQAALVDMALRVHEHRLAALNRGVPAARIEQVDLSPVFRAREEGTPSDVTSVAQAEHTVLAALDALS